MFKTGKSYCKHKRAQILIVEIIFNCIEKLLGGAAETFDKCRLWLLVGKFEFLSK
jgi:hypothetical protein